MLLDEVGLWFLASCLEGCQTIFFPPSCNKSLSTWLSGFAGPLLAFVSIPVHLPLNERGAVQPKAELQVEWCAAYIIQELVWSSLEHMFIKFAWNYRFFCQLWLLTIFFLTQNCPENSRGVIFPFLLPHSILTLLLWFLLVQRNPSGPPTPNAFYNTVLYSLTETFPVLPLEGQKMLFVILPEQRLG